MQNLQIDAQRLWDTLMETANFGATAKGGIKRLTLSDDDRQVRDWFKSAAQAIGCTVTVEPSVSTFAEWSFWVCTMSWGKIADELGAGFPFSQTPESLCSIAPPEDWAINEAGKTTIITPQTSLRHSSKRNPAFSPHQLLVQG